MENLQDQSQVMLGQHNRSHYPGQPVRYRCPHVPTGDTGGGDTRPRPPLCPPGSGSCCCCSRRCASSPRSAWSCSSSAGPSATPPWRSCCATCSRTDPCPPPRVTRHWHPVPPALGCHPGRCGGARGPISRVLARTMGRCRWLGHGDSWGQRDVPEQVAAALGAPCWGDT